MLSAIRSDCETRNMVSSQYQIERIYMHLSETTDAKQAVAQLACSYADTRSAQKYCNAHRNRNIVTV